MYDVLRIREAVKNAPDQVSLPEGAVMKRAKFAVFSLVLAGAVAAAVVSLAAQASQEEQGRRRPRVMMLDGRGAQIGVTVDETAEGVRIADVDQDGPAAKAGMRSGDVVTEVDGERVRSARQFSRLIQESPGSRSVKLGVLRDGKRQTIEVTPESRSWDFGIDAARIGREVERSMRDIEPRLRELEPRLRELEPRLREFRFDGPMDFDFNMLPRLTSPRARLGVQLNELTPELAQYFGAKDGGVLVASVTKDSPAEKAGLKAGDVITSIDSDRVRHANDVVDELRDKSGEVTIGIVRDKRESSVKATVEDARPRPGFRRPA
jgi:serine protease Do